MLVGMEPAPGATRLLADGNQTPVPGLGMSSRGHVCHWPA